MISFEIRVDNNCMVIFIYDINVTSFLLKTCFKLSTNWILNIVWKKYNLVYYVCFLLLDINLTIKNNNIYI